MRGVTAITWCARSTRTSRSINSSSSKSPAICCPTNEEAITATGFLALGARVLAEPDMQKLEMDIIDEQIDTIGKAFMGMTLGCVRCHDHKFDPIRQEDYYAMAAIFRSTRSLATEKMGAIKFWYEHSLATPEQLEAKKKFDEAAQSAKKAAVAAFTSKARERGANAGLQQHAADYLAAAALLPARGHTRGRRVGGEGAETRRGHFAHMPPVSGSAPRSSGRLRCGANWR